MLSLLFTPAAGVANWINSSFKESHNIAVTDVSLGILLVSQTEKTQPSARNCKLWTIQLVKKAMKIAAEESRRIYYLVLFVDFYFFLTSMQSINCVDKSSITSEVPLGDQDRNGNKSKKPKAKDPERRYPGAITVDLLNNKTNSRRREASVRNVLGKVWIKAAKKLCSAC
ncbi:unnamed protein product [Lepeophtheirus salmonis]|uniref:(salmon louse) hypothetical protein n=1 Tax=Lepeophtheirus salmonis TaxID=72036 RepID=A0A7R8HAL7_LEPSM|nr:unnamed protein product [Lepeophtheirus salmonis]CAF2958397.1 unnamed protein product [Lepeophtheirus salmonis]